MGMVPNGLLPNASAGVTRRLDPERWAVAESRTAELIARIQPNAHSEGRRQAVYSYVQRLIMNCLSCQVFTFGSVPLKTYLPDGDIDVTAFSNSEELKDTWANLVRDALEHEEKSLNAEFRVKEVQYIQAEVKIIKCLVDNIIVDISFNQVGGLCTLCFLEEIDNLINQNHLFKRSIILIKAWCFYESRILGAHHGLISTYALETLVLYIFHVFNNCFTGPLEVLYRFLEFFSNFDWEKFCLSLWGPVPISSLPDMTAESPRMDTSELLLSKSFLDNCSDKYAVTLHPQESRGQPFISKQFNVIDPLRTNNNLGRSVSKGNFFRIRSAFSFGAKRLAKLLECPKEDIIAEVNQFFTNTWIRHGSGSHPDAPTPSLVHEHPLKVVPAEASSSHISATTPNKMVENPKLRANQGNLAEGAHSYPELTSQPPQKSDLHSRNSPRTVNPAGSHTQHQKVYATQANTKVSEQLERNRSGGSMQSERDKRMPNAIFVNDRNGQNRSWFARTRSSPELTDPSIEGYSHGRRTRVVEMETNLKVDYNSRRNNLAPEVSSNHSTKSSQDESVSSMNSSSHPSAKATSDSNSVSSSYREDNGFMMNEELPSVYEAEALEMQHEEHVLVNLMASAKLHGFNQQVQLPMQRPSHMSVASSPLLAPTAFSQKQLDRIPPTSLIGTPWLPNMQFLHRFVPPPMAHYVHNPTFAPNTEDGNKSVKPITSDANPDDGNNWHEYGVGLSRHFSHDVRDPHMHHFDGKERISKPNGVSGVPLERQTEFNVEDGVVEENYINMFQNQTSREVGRNVPMGCANVRISSSQASSSSRSKAAMEAAAALSPPRVALDARALFSPPPALPASPSSHLRLAARPRALAASPATAPKPRFLSPHPDPAGRGARDVVAMVVPFLRGTAREQPPPDLASFLYKNRIVYLGMCLVPSVTELMLAEFLYLQYEDAEKPIYLYINSTGTTKNGEKLGYETEAFAIYDAMRYVKIPIYTLCVGNAWGEAALLLAAGAKGNRAALPSSTIMIKQPIGRFQGQATDVDIARKEIRNVKMEMVKLMSRHIGKPMEEIARDIRRPKYFSPSEAMDYGIIDKVLYNEKSQGDGGVVSELKRSNLI